MGIGPRKRSEPNATSYLTTVSRHILLFTYQTLTLLLLFSPLIASSTILTAPLSLFSILYCSTTTGTSGNADVASFVESASWKFSDGRKICRSRRTRWFLLDGLLLSIWIWMWERLGKGEENYLIAAELGNVEAKRHLGYMLDKTNLQRFIWLHIRTSAQRTYRHSEPINIWKRLAFQCTYRSRDSSSCILQLSIAIVS